MNRLLVVTTVLGLVSCQSWTWVSTSTRTSWHTITTTCTDNAISTLQVPAIVFTDVIGEEVGNSSHLTTSCVTSTLQSWSGWQDWTTIATSTFPDTTATRKETSAVYTASVSTSPAGSASSSGDKASSLTASTPNTPTALSSAIFASSISASTSEPSSSVAPSHSSSSASTAAETDSRSSSEMIASPITTKVTLTSLVTNFIPQPDGSTSTQLSTITPVVETTVIDSQGQSSVSTPSNSSSTIAITQSTMASEVTNYLVTDGRTQTQVSTITAVVNITISTDTAAFTVTQTQGTPANQSSSSLTSTELNSQSAAFTSSLAASSAMALSGTSPSSILVSSIGSTLSSMSIANSSSTHLTGSGLVTDNGATYTVVVSVNAESSTSTTETRLIPSFTAQTTSSPAVGATLSLPLAPSTTPFVIPAANFDNPLSHTGTTPCTYVPKGYTSTVTYNPWCVTSDGSKSACLCPFCAATDQNDCFTTPSSGVCPKSWLCDLKQTSSTADWILPPEIDVPSSITDWSIYVQCVTNSKKDSCSSVTHSARVSKSTTTNIDGWVVEFGWRWWYCPDALCNPENFVVRLLKCIFNLNCITGWFHGFPPAPVLVIPPIGPPERDPEIAPHTLSNVDGRPPPTPNSQITTKPSQPPKSCTGSSTFTYTTRYCSTVSASNETTVTGCSDVVATTIACTGEGSITTSTVPCLSGPQTGVIIECPANYTTTAQCFTNTTTTYTGCSATMSTIFDACATLSMDYDEVMSTLSAWIQQFPYTLPTVTSGQSTGVTIAPTVTSSVSVSDPLSGISDLHSKVSSINSLISQITASTPMSTMSLPPSQAVASKAASDAAYRLPQDFNLNKQNQTYCDYNMAPFNITDIAFYNVLWKVCDYLSAEEIFRPGHGFYYTLSPRDNKGKYPASGAGNLTFAVQWSTHLWCENCGCDFVEDEYCPPEKYGNVSQDIWSSGDFCHKAFVKAAGQCIDKDGPRRAWSRGGWFATNGFIFSVLAYYPSPSFYQDVMGNGTEDIRWTIDPLLDGNPLPSATIVSTTSVTVVPTDIAGAEASKKAHDAAFAATPEVRTKGRQLNFCADVINAETDPRTRPTEGYQMFNTGEKAFLAVIDKVCDHLSNEATFDPDHGFYYTYGSKTNQGTFPATNAGNITFSIEWAPKLWSDRATCSYLDPKMCPPPEDGKIGHEFWESGDSCRKWFQAAGQAKMCTIQSGKYKGWGVGGWYTENGLVIGVIGEVPSPLFYSSLMGDGSQMLDWSFKDIWDGTPNAKVAKVDGEEDALLGGR